MNCKSRDVDAIKEAGYKTAKFGAREDDYASDLDTAVSNNSPSGAK